jgi:hypothetical protein
MSEGSISLTSQNALVHFNLPEQLLCFPQFLQAEISQTGGIVELKVLEELDVVLAKCWSPSLRTACGRGIGGCS